MLILPIRKLVGELNQKGPYINSNTQTWWIWNGTKFVDSKYPYKGKAPDIEFTLEENGDLYVEIKENE